MTKQDIETNVAKNNLLDRIMMGVAAFVLLALSMHTLLQYIRAVYPANYLLGGGMLLLVLYALLAPVFRK